MRLLRFISQRFIRIITLCFAVALLLSAWLPFISPEKWWPADIAGLFFPYLLAICVVLMIYWAWVKFPYALILFVCIALSGKSLLSTFGWHFFHRSTRGESGDIRLLSYNVSSFGGSPFTPHKSDSAKGLQIIPFLKNAQPDIFCLLEFYSDSTNIRWNTLQKLKQAFPGYNFYFNIERQLWNHRFMGSVLGSRYPVMNARSVTSVAAKRPRSILEADLLIGGDTIRFVGVHLKSFYLRGEEYGYLNEISHPGGGSLAALKKLLWRVKAPFIVRAKQADQLRDLLAKSPYPVLLCGDFNTTPVSYPYYTVSRHLQDAFLKARGGVGRTFAFLLPTLRIDYIFTGERFGIRDFRIYPQRLSDHFAIEATIRLPGK